MMNRLATFNFTTYDAARAYAENNRHELMHGPRGRLQIGAPAPKHGYAPYADPVGQYWYVLKVLSIGRRVDVRI